MSRNTHAQTLLVNGQLTPAPYSFPCKQKDAARKEKGLPRRKELRDEGDGAKEEDCGVGCGGACVG